MAGALIKDRAWVRNAFLVTSTDAGKLAVQNRTATSASQKFTDTTPGGNFAINPPPQFTRYADPKARTPAAIKNGDNGTFSPYAGSRGQGVYYSEAIDDNAQVIYMRFGVPQFNSLTTFFTGFYDSSAGQLARTGRGDSAFYVLGKAIGFVASIIYWPLLIANVLGSGLRFFLQKPSSKFYYLKPTMPVYWNAVQTIVNHLAVNRGIIPRVSFPWDDAQKEKEVGERFGEPYSFDKAALGRLYRLLPDVFNEKGGIDVFKLATRAQRLARARHKQRKMELDNDSKVDILKRIQQIEDSPLVEGKRRSFSEYMEQWWKSAPSKGKSGDDSSGANVESADVSQTANAGWAEFLEAEMDDGGAFACFRVNSTGSVGESFSNNVGESEISQKINSMSSSSRSTNFNFAGGNIVGGVAGELLGKIGMAAKDLATGVAEGLHISGVAALGGAAFVDIPKHWQSSTAQLPRANYTVNLRSWSGDPISQLLNLYIPLAMLLAGAMPLSTGRHSYTSPFILELYDQGRCQTRLGMIDSMSVTRGVGNLGFNSDGNMMGCDVTFSVIDLSSIMHMPIAEGFTFNAASAGADAGAVIGGTAGAIGGSAAGIVGTVAGGAAGAAGGAAIGSTVGAGIDAVSAIGAAIKGSFSDDTPFNDYMAVISGMGLADQIYSYRKLKLNLTRQGANLQSFFSAAHYASVLGDSMPGRLISSIYKGTAR